jgi:ketosteroid isomerase-like protein
MKNLPALFAVALAACAATPPSMDVPASLAAAEAAFAAHSMRENMRPAFLANFADDGVTVRPTGWVVSNAYLATRPDPPITLDWRPQYVEVALSGELGLSTGPTKLTANAKPGEPRFGQYVSVWRRVESGTWKVVVDLGIGNDGPRLWDQPLIAGYARGGHPSPNAGTIHAAEAAFTKESAANGMRSAYAALGATNLRFYRDDGGPVQGLEAAKAAPGMNDDKLAWTVERAEVARSGDLAYAIGSYARAASPGTPAGHYLRVWRNEGGRWRVAMDVVNVASS